MSARHSTQFEESKKICSLKIKQAKPDDAGIYSLVVENPYGSDNCSAPVQLVPAMEPRPKLHPNAVNVLPTPPQRPEPVISQKTIPPKFIKLLPPETFANEGDNIVFEVIIEGSPTPQVISEIQIRFFVLVLVSLIIFFAFLDKLFQKQSIDARFVKNPNDLRCKHWRHYD